MLVAAFVGPSSSGKTTLIRELIAFFVAEGRTVGAIKHTHHALNDERRGDTATFADAGAEPVIFAGDGEAVLFRGHRVERFPFRSPHDLLARFETDIVFIEGFKSGGNWPRIELDHNKHIGTQEALAILDTIWREP
jgi:molybdopterin-guanine dinucleotide biosynthesis protein MobB